MHFSLEKRLVPRPVVFLEGFLREESRPPAGQSVFAHRLHRRSHIHIDVVEGGPETLGVLDPAAILVDLLDLVVVIIWTL